MRSCAIHCSHAVSFGTCLASRLGFGFARSYPPPERIVGRIIIHRCDARNNLAGRTWNGHAERLGHEALEIDRYLRSFVFTFVFPELQWRPAELLRPAQLDVPDREQAQHIDGTFGNHAHQ